MSSNPSAVDSATIERTKNQIRGLVNEIAQLSKSDLEPERYYAEFLQRIVSALAAPGGAIWLSGTTSGGAGRLNLVYQINLPEILLERDSEDSQRHSRLVGALMRNGEPQLAPPMSSMGEDGSVGNPTPYLLVTHPLRSGENVEGLVEVFQRGDGQPATQRGYLRFLAQMCELAGEWLKTRKLITFSDRQSLWGQLDTFARLVHENLDRRGTCYAICNEGRRILGCDRVSVAVRKGRKCVIEAISGQDTIEGRSNIVHTLNDLASRVCATEEPLWYTGVTDDLPPQVEKALDAYVEESFAKSVTVLPLRRPNKSEAADERHQEEDESALKGEVVGALIIEQIESSLPRAALEPKVDLVFQHSSRALSNALTYNNLFMMPIWRTLGKASVVMRARTLPKTLAVAAIVLAIILSLCFVPWDFAMKAKGSLEPIVQRNVFVETPGVVEELFVEHGDVVKKGDRIARLENRDLSVQLEEVRGSLHEAQEREFAIKRRLYEGRGISPEEKSQLFTQLAQLKEELISLKNQRKLLEEKKNSLTVRSPIDGVVITWEVRDRLHLRPVNTGEVLVTVADPDKEWVLKLQMPENRMGHINAAFNRLPEGAEKQLSVSYRLASAPGDDLHGWVKLADVRGAAELHEEEGHTVVMRVAVDKAEILQTLNLTKGEDAQGDKPLRTGTTVTAKVACGRRPLGYVLFHQAWEWLQMNVFFHL